MAGSGHNLPALRGVSAQLGALLMAAVAPQALSCVAIASAARRAPFGHTSNLMNEWHARNGSAARRPVE